MYERQQNLLENILPAGIRAMPERSGGWFDLDDWVGPGHPSGRADIAKIEGILANSGDYSLKRTQGPTGYWGLALDDGIRAYQKRNGLKVDGTLRPGGPTIHHMKDRYGALLGGFAPPMPDEIDRHHDSVSDDDPGLIAWQPPRAKFADIADLPEIGQEADASNARTVRAMLRTGDVEGFAPLMKAAIDQGGKNAFAEVADLAKKLQEASPSFAGRFTGKIAELMTPEQRETYRVELESSQPPGTVQMAMMRRDSALRQSDASESSGLRPTGLPGLDAGLAIIPALKGLTDKFADPRFMAVDPESKPGQAPAPEQVEKPSPLGGTMETPKASDSIETLPADPGEKPDLLPLPVLKPDERKELVGKFLDEFNVVLSEGQYIDNRGLPKTVRLNNVTAKACAQAISESPFPEAIKQLGGASDEGGEQKYREEKNIEVAENKNRRPDYLMGVTDKNGKIEHAAAINTVSTRADGNPTLREQKPLDELIRAKVIRFVDWLAKVGNDGDPDDSFDAAYKKCKKGVGILVDEIRADIAAGKRDPKGQPK